jgi:hypothetical protein
MKNRFKSLLTLTLFAATAMFIFSCSGDDATPKSTFTFDGNTVTIQSADFYFDPISSESPVDGEPYHRHDIYLLAGEGNFIELFISGATVNLDPGTYQFTGTEEDPKAYELWDGRVTYDGNEHIFEEATLTIAKSGSNFTIEFTATAYPPDEVSPWLPDLTKPAKSLHGKFVGPTNNVMQD